MSGHFASPQAAPLPLWGPLESTLLPQDCGACHPAQLTAWEGSRHSRSMGPGVLLQLVDDPGLVAQCQPCHAPLAEQLPAAGHDALRASGVGCAACHVRDGVVHGPPPRAPSQITDPPHGGFEAHPWFEDSAFCARCHQFPATGFRLGGVLLENTVEEWKASPQAQRGETCQTCHMPDRQHLWRGIHDQATTEAALDVEFEVGRRTATYRVTNAGAGHHLPTYVTPRLTLHLRALDAQGAPVAHASQVIQRRVDVYLKAQEFDSRLPPGGSAEVRIAWERRDAAVRVEAWVEVEPDEFYERFFDVLTPKGEASAALHAQVQAEMKVGHFRVGDRTATLD